MCKVKIIQLLPMPNDATYQGVVFGLGDDGVVYHSTSEGWDVAIPLDFKEEKLTVIKDNNQTTEVESDVWYRDKGTFDHAFWKLDADIKNAVGYNKDHEHLAYKLSTDSFYTSSEEISHTNDITYTGLVSDFRCLCGDYMSDLD